MYRLRFFGFECGCHQSFLNQEPETRNSKPSLGDCGAKPGEGPRPAARTLCVLLLSIVVCGTAQAASPTAPPTPRVPDGVAAAKFGMTVEQARQRYPDLAPAPVMIGAAYVISPDLSRYVVPKIELPGLPGDSSLELRFWKKQLWSIIVYYGSTPFPTVLDYLRREYGPTAATTGDPTWTLGKVAIVTSPGQMWYSLEDSEVSKEVRSAWLAALQELQKRKVSPTKAPAPAAQGTPVTPGPGAAP
jgi:hypothetical protein